MEETDAMPFAKSISTPKPPLTFDPSSQPPPQASGRLPRGSHGMVVEYTPETVGAIVAYLES